MKGSGSSFSEQKFKTFTEKLREFLAKGTDGTARKVVLPSSPAYPLARIVEMAESWAYPRASIAFRFEEMIISGFENFRIDPAQFTDKTIRFRILLEELFLSGKYTVETKPDLIPELDTAGNLSELSLGSDTPQEGGGDSETDPDPQKEAWLDQAREERDRLSSTNNGQKLLGAYNEHNETYDEVFKTYKALTNAWRAGGATKEMASDTSGALKSDEVINSSTKKYVGGVTYNGNAFAQQLNVAAACLYADPNFNEETGPPQGSKYWEAAKAALSFGKGVGDTTGNQKAKVKEMKPSEVHSSVDSHSGELPSINDSDVGQVLAATDLGPGGRGEGQIPDWLDLDEEDRERLRNLKHAILKEKAENSDLFGLPLFQGELNAKIRGSFISVFLHFQEGRDIPEVHDMKVSMPAFLIEIDDSNWSGIPGKIVRERLENTSFIQNLLYSSFSENISFLFSESVKRAFS
ncbi:hypothetical protein ACQV5M_16715 [Leptospira sp. SA-E8]|uniref:hypothetical protein n=1 Tax=Leptospira sp. SA-E8 TaxID=3422259 RepID=UPI003EBD84E6